MSEKDKNPRYELIDCGNIKVYAFHDKSWDWYEFYSVDSRGEHFAGDVTVSQMKELMKAIEKEVE
jgi:hypothetical protein